MAGTPNATEGMSSGNHERAERFVRGSLLSVGQRRYLRVRTILNDAGGGTVYQYGEWDDPAVLRSGYSPGDGGNGLRMWWGLWGLWVRMRRRDGCRGTDSASGCVLDAVNTPPGNSIPGANGSNWVSGQASDCSATTSDWLVGVAAENRVRVTDTEELRGECRLHPGNRCGLSLLSGIGPGQRWWIPETD